MEMG
jgi:hypothetical protein